jgi:hypothetical protein
MIRSVYEYNHREWLSRMPAYSFCGMRIEDMEPAELRAALAFMVQYAGDCKNRLHAAEVE